MVEFFTNVALVLAAVLAVGVVWFLGFMCWLLRDIPGDMLREARATWKIANHYQRNAFVSCLVAGVLSGVFLMLFIAAVRDLSLLGMLGWGVGALLFGSKVFEMFFEDTMFRHREEKRRAERKHSAHLNVLRIAHNQALAEDAARARREAK